MNTTQGLICLPIGAVGMELKDGESKENKLFPLFISKLSIGGNRRGSYEFLKPWAKRKISQVCTCALCWKMYQDTIRKQEHRGSAFVINDLRASVMFA